MQVACCTNDPVAYAGIATPHSTCRPAKAPARSSSYVASRHLSSKILVSRLATKNPAHAISYNQSSAAANTDNLLLDAAAAQPLKIWS